LRGQTIEWLTPALTYCVHQNVPAPGLLQKGANGIFGGDFVAHVKRQRVHLAWYAVGGFLKCLLIATAEPDIGAMGCQGMGNLTAQPARGTGDQRSAPGELKK
jgi:hypothetical protein